MERFLDHDHFERRGLCGGAKEKGGGMDEEEGRDRWFVCVEARARGTREEGNLLGGCSRSMTKRVKK